MYFIENFTDKARRGEKNIFLSHNNANIDYIGVEQGNAVFYYGCNGYETPPAYNPNSKFELAAVMENDTKRIWLVNPFLFNKVTYPNKLPLGVHPLSVKRADIEMNLMKAYDKLAPTLPLKKIDYSKEIWSLERKLKVEARRRALGFTPNIYRWSYEVIYESVLRILSGAISEEEYIGCVLKTETNKIIRTLEEEKAIADYEKSAATEDEKDLSLSVLKSGARGVTVKFFKNGKSMTVKMSISIMLAKLLMREAYEWRDFDTQRQGKEVLKELGQPLRCDDITEITYRGKTLYSMPF